MKISEIDKFKINLKRLREERGLSQYELSDMTGVTQSFLSNLENGKKTNPTLTTLAVIASAFEVSIVDLLS